MRPHPSRLRGESSSPRPGLGHVSAISPPSSHGLCPSPLSVLLIGVTSAWSPPGLWRGQRGEQNPSSTLRALPGCICEEPVSKSGHLLKFGADEHLRGVAQPTEGPSWAGLSLDHRLLLPLGRPLALGLGYGPLRHHHAQGPSFFLVPFRFPATPTWNGPFWNCPEGATPFFWGRQRIQWPPLSTRSISFYPIVLVPMDHEAADPPRRLSGDPASAPGLCSWP